MGLLDKYPDDVLEQFGVGGAALSKGSGISEGEGREANIIEVLKSLRDAASASDDARSGVETITGVADTADITFATAMPDATYVVNLTAEEGTVPANVNAWASNKTATGFRINLSAAPGGTDTNLVNWSVVAATQ